MIVRDLISAGAAVNASDTDETTALMRASVYGHDVIVRDLISAGADMNRIDDEGYTALIYAVNEDKSVCVARLLMEGADDTIVDHDGMTAFQLAVSNGRPYGVADAWEGMKGGMCESKVDAVLSSAIAAASGSGTPLSSNPNPPPPPPLAAFFGEGGVHASFLMMEGIMSFLTGPLDPRFVGGGGGIDSDDEQGD